jgi:hypothetical protein
LEGQPGRQGGIGHRLERGEELVAELPPDCRADLGQRFGRAQAVETRRQRVAQRGGYGHCARAGSVRVVGGRLGEITTLEDGPGQLLDEKGNPVGLLDDLLEQPGRERLAAGEADYQRAALRRGQPAQVHRAHVGLRRPAGREFRTVGEHGKERDVAHPRDQLAKHFQRARVRPVKVFEQEQRRSGVRDRLDEVHQRPDGLLLLPARAHRQEPVPVLEGKRQDRREQREITGRPGKTTDDERLELVQAGRRGLVPGVGQHSLEARGDRLEGAVEVIWRALEPQRTRPVRLQQLAERPNEPALADSRFAGQRDHLALAGAGHPPPLQQASELLLATDQWRHRLTGCRIEAAHGRALPQHSIGAGGRADPLQCLFTQVFVLEGAAGEALHPPTHQDLARRGDRLEPGREVHGLAHRAALRGGDDHHSGRNADPYPQAPGHGDLQPPQGVQDLQPRADGALGLALVRERKAEERHDPVPQALEDVAVVPGDTSGARILVLPDDAVQDLRVDSTGELGEPDHIAEQDRELPALLAGPGSGGSDVRIVQFGERLQDPLARAEWKTQLLEIVVGEDPKGAEVDIVLREERGVLLQLMGPEPACERVRGHRHRGTRMPRSNIHPAMASPEGSGTWPAHACASSGRVMPGRSCRRSGATARPSRNATGSSSRGWRSAGLSTTNSPSMHGRSTTSS